MCSLGIKIIRQHYSASFHNGTLPRRDRLPLDLVSIDIIALTASLFESYWYATLRQS
jgi:hypothetical protein